MVEIWNKLLKTTKISSLAVNDNNQYGSKLQQQTRKEKKKKQQQITQRNFVISLSKIYSAKNQKHFMSPDFVLQNSLPYWMLCRNPLLVSGTQQEQRRLNSEETEVFDHCILPSSRSLPEIIRHWNYICCGKGTVELGAHIVLTSCK